MPWNSYYECRRNHAIFLLCNSHLVATSNGRSLSRRHAVITRARCQGATWEVWGRNLALERNVACVRHKMARALTVTMIDGSTTCNLQTETRAHKTMTTHRKRILDHMREHVSKQSRAKLGEICRIKTTHTCFYQSANSRAQSISIKKCGRDRWPIDPTTGL